MAHGHHHHHGNCGHSHEEQGDPVHSFSLYQKIDLINCTCLNEHEDGAGKLIFKPWEERLDVTKFVESDVDEELLFYIPFTGNIKLKGLILLGGEGGKHPDQLRLFKNRNPQSFDEVRGEPEQVIQVAYDASASNEYTLKASRFNSISSLVIHIPGNHGDEVTRVYYIGLRGDFLSALRPEVTIATYEASPNPSDHKTTLHQPVSDFIS